jgi:hypothetical protein
MLYKCPDCKESKPESDFHRSSTLKRGFGYYCKPCQNAMSRKKRNDRKENGPTVIRTSKVCAKCWNLKPVSQFGVNRGASDGFVSYCKPCWVGITQKAQARQKKK